MEAQPPRILVSTRRSPITPTTERLTSRGRRALRATWGACPLRAEVEATRPVTWRACTLHDHSGTVPYAATSASEAVCPP